VFANRYFGRGYFAARYFGVGGEPPPGGGHFGHRYFGARYFGSRYFSPLAEPPPDVRGGHFGHRYFGLRYFGHRYFSPFAEVGPQPPVDGGGSGYRRVRIPVDRLTALQLQRDDELLLFVAAAMVTIT
jgi:hypothetical protein